MSRCTSMATPTPSWWTRYEVSPSEGVWIATTSTSADRTDMTGLPADSIPPRRYRCVVAVASLPVVDTMQRPMHDLRVSVTDRCNFRCTYCMPKEIFNREWEFLSRDALLSFEEIERLVRASADLGVAQGEAHRGRTAAAARPGAVGRDAGRGPRDRGSHPHHQRVAAGPQGAVAGRRRSQPGHRQPRLDGRHRLPGDERRRFPGGEGPGGDRGRRRRRPHPGQGEHGGAARGQRGLGGRPGPPLQGHRAHPPLHRVHGCGHHQRLADGRRLPGRSDRRGHRPGVSPRPGTAQLPGRGGQPLPLPRRVRARSVSSHR